MPAQEHQLAVIGRLHFLLAEEADVPCDLLDSCLKLGPLQHFREAALTETQLDHLVGHVSGVAHRLLLAGSLLSLALRPPTVWVLFAAFRGATSLVELIGVIVTHVGLPIVVEDDQFSLALARHSELEEG